MVHRRRKGTSLGEFMVVFVAVGVILIGGVYLLMPGGNEASQKHPADHHDGVVGVPVNQDADLKRLAELKAEYEELSKRLDVALEKKRRAEHQLEMRKLRESATTLETRSRACAADNEQYLDRGPLTQVNSKPRSTQRVKRHLMVASETEVLPGTALNVDEEWRRLEPCFARWTLTESACIDRAEAFDGMIDVFKSLNEKQREGVCGLLAVHHFGGVFMDRNVKRRPNRPLRIWLDLRNPVIFGQSGGTVVPWFFGGEHLHPCWKEALGEVIAASKGGLIQDETDVVSLALQKALPTCSDNKAAFQADTLDLTSISM